MFARVAGDERPGVGVSRLAGSTRSARSILHTFA